MAATSMSPQTAATTIAPSTARGRSVKNHVNRIEHDDDEDGGDQAGDLARRAGARRRSPSSTDCPATAIPLESPAATFEAPTPMSSRSVSTR